MKKRLLLIAIVAMLLPMSMMAQAKVTDPDTGLEYLDDGDGRWYITANNSTYFGNTNLRPFWRRAFNNDGTKFYKEDLEKVTEIGIGPYSYGNNKTTTAPNGTSTTTMNFKGIEYFTNLESLTINAGNAKSVTLDLSKNKKLTSLTFNQETIKLGTLDISNTQLTELTIPTGSATTLTVLRAKNSQLTSLDLSSCTKIATLEISDNPTLTTLTMPSTASALKTFNCSNTGITPSLDLSGCSNLTSFNAKGCSSLTSLTLPTTKTKLQTLDISDTGVTSLSVTGYTALTSLVADNTPITNLSVSGCSKLASLSLSGCTSLTSLTLPTAGKLKNLDISNTENSLSDNYTIGSPWDLRAYGLELNFANTGFVLNENLILFGNDSERITVDMGTPTEISFEDYPNLVYLKINNASKVTLPSGRTEFELDLWDSPETEVDWNGNDGNEATLTTLKVNNMKTFDATGKFPNLESLSHTGPLSEELILTKDHTTLTFLDISRSGIKTIDFSGGDDPATAEPIAPNLITFRAMFSALEEVDLSWHTDLVAQERITGGLLKGKDPNESPGFWITPIPKCFSSYGYENTITDVDAYNTNNPLRVIKLRGCTGLTGPLVLSQGFSQVSADTWIYYNNIEEVDVSGCENITGLYCMNTLLTKLNTDNCKEMTRVEMDQGLLTGLVDDEGNCDISMKFCNKLNTFIAKRHRWENLDFLLVPTTDDGADGRRTIAEIAKMRNIQVNGGSYTLQTTEDNAEDRTKFVRKDKDGNELIYTCRLREIDLSNMVCWDGVSGHDGLQKLLVDCNLLKQLDLSVVGPGLTELACTNNMLTTLDLTHLNMDKVTSLSCQYQVGWLPAEIVKGHWSSEEGGKWMDTRGDYDWVALHMENGGFTHRMDNDFGLYRNLHDARFNNNEGQKPIASEAKPWMCKVQEIPNIATNQLEGWENFKGTYPCPTGHSGQHIFLHSQAEITKDFGAFKDQDLTDCVLSYKFNTGLRQTRVANTVSPDDTDNYSLEGYDDLVVNEDEGIDQKDEAHIIVRMHLFPYLLNVNPVSKNDFSASELSKYGEANVDYYSSTVILDYDALIPEGVSVYTISGINERSVFEVRGKGVDGQLKAELFGGDGHSNKILPANTPVYVRVLSKVDSEDPEKKVEQPAGLYAFQPIREVAVLGWENLRGNNAQEDYVLHGMEKLNDGEVKTDYVTPLAEAIELLNTEPHSKNVLRGFIAPKYDVHINNANYNYYLKDGSGKEITTTSTYFGGTTNEPKDLTPYKVLTLGIQNQTSAWPVIGFWPYRGNKLNTNRCYIPYEDIYDEQSQAQFNPQTAKGFNFFFVNEEKEIVDVTGVRELNDKWKEFVEGWYNMNGVRLNGEPTQPGVYIHNGKKVTVK